MNVLVKLHKGYGLGDVVQTSVVLQHIAKYCPHWCVDFQAEAHKHKVGRGHVANTFAYGQPFPTDHYDAEVELTLFNTYANWHDRPNTHITTCLRQHLDIDWDAEIGRYQVVVSGAALADAATLLHGGERRSSKRKYYAERAGVVAVHYEGDSIPENKNLHSEEVQAICWEIERLEYEPVILDWRNQCRLRDYRRITTPQQWGGDPEMVCAVISQCKAFVGIDSGPAKCASATETPSLVIWTKHHPAVFHDPAPNTTHLVPEGYHDLYPVRNEPGVVRWFEANYNMRTYRHGGLVVSVAKWLKEILK